MSSQNTKPSIKRISTSCAKRPPKKRDGTSRAKLRVSSVSRLEDRFSNFTLEDMLSASQVILDQSQGFGIPQIRLSTATKRIIAPNPRTGRTISLHRLNSAIVQRNQRDNKPTKRARAIYKKMMNEE